MNSCFLSYVSLTSVARRVAHTNETVDNEITMSFKISIISALNNCKNENHDMIFLVLSFHEVRSLHDYESQVHFFSCFKLVFYCHYTLCNSNLS